LRQRGIFPPHSSHLRFSAGASTISAMLANRSRSRRSHSVEQQRKPLLSKPLPQAQQLMKKPCEPVGSP